MALKKSLLKKLIIKILNKTFIKLIILIQVKNRNIQKKNKNLSTLKEHK